MFSIDLENAWRATKTTWLARILHDLIFGQATEKPKVVLLDPKKCIFYKLIAHILPVSATIVLFWFDVTGYFIGATLVGPISARIQDIDRLCLQVTAKLFELLIVFSLSIIVADEVRERLLFHKHGLPLGLLQAHNQFSDIVYLATHEFRAGWRGIRSKVERYLFGVLIVTCSLVALLAGPSSALLVTPTWHTDWPAGGAKFWLNGNLNPTHLDLSTVEGVCFSYEKDRSLLEAADWLFASCPWAGYPYLKRYFDQQTIGASHHISYNYKTLVQDLSLDWADGTEIIWVIDSVRTWAVASNIAIAAFARHIANIDWPQAEYTGGISAKGPRANYRYNLLNGTAGRVEGYVPLVRIQCWRTDLHMDPEPPPDPPERTQYLPFPVIPDFAGAHDRGYWIPVAARNSTYTSTEWLQVPTSSTVTNDGFNVSTYPSAFLIVRNAPYPGLDPTILTCSVQTDWVPGTHVTSLVQYEVATNQYAILHQRDISHMETWTTDPNAVLDPNGTEGPPPTFDKPSNWQHISLSTDWLKVLTPAHHPDRPGYTTLASTLEHVLRRVEPPALSPNIFPDSVIFEQITSIVATFVADGLSRFGWDQNYSYNISRSSVFPFETSQNSSTPGWNFGETNWHHVWRAIMHDTAVLRPNKAYRQEEGQMYPLKITIEGFGMNVQGTAYALAMAVLGVYLCLVVYHVFAILRPGRRSHGSACWSSPIDMLVLAQASDPCEHALMNTCAGVKSHQTLKVPVRIRATNSNKVARESVQLYLDSSLGSSIRAKEQYGAYDGQKQNHIKNSLIARASTL